METELVNLKKEYYTFLDNKAKTISEKLSKNKPITQEILTALNELYKSVDCEKEFINNTFECAYHMPVTSEFEFFVSRILYHYSEIKKLDWKIYLRRQSKGKDGKLHVPDIRIEKNSKTMAIIEIKAKAGWIQPFFSSERVKKDLKRFKAGKSDFHPMKKIAEIKKSLQAYSYNYNIPYKKVYLLLPTLALVHRKKNERNISDYKKDFSKNSGLNKQNLILLSQNLNLNLSSKNIPNDHFNPTNEFENFIKVIS
ncbi:MAG TPA: hypothetical protein VJH65_00575 [Candidatus Nanoarchaeia archaeon]|nr:hypothetical protein [Candidatus Nanoarchaeia archaeon]